MFRLPHLPRPWWRICLTLPFLLAAFSAAAVTATVESVTDGDTLRARIGAEAKESEAVRLVGIQAPEMEREDEETGYVRPAEPLAEASREALKRLTEGRTFELRYPGRRLDRFGRHLALLAEAKGASVQEAMLREGWAMVYLFPDNALDPSPFLAAEEEARRHKRGLWADPYYAVIDEKEAESHIGRYKLVTGVPLNVVTIKGRTYVNFGENWKTDFTLHIAPEYRELFKGVDVKALEGKRIRARGWIRLKNGPVIDLTHPGQLEILDR